MLPVKKPPAKPSGKLMRLRCRLRPLFEGYSFQDHILDRDCDVTFECQGGHARAHKVILSVVSKFFCNIFADQKPYKPTTVYVPDIPVATMKLILRLCYRDSIKMSMSSMKELGSYLHLFGLSLDQFNFTDVEEEDKPNHVPSRIISSSAGRQATPARPVANAHQLLTIKKPGGGTVTGKPTTILYGGKAITTSGGIITADSAIFKNSTQTFVLDTSTLSNGSEDGGDGNVEYKFRLQPFKIQGMQKSDQQGKPQPRPILPKPTNTHQATPAKIGNSGGPPLLKRMPEAKTQSISLNSSGIEVEVGGLIDSDDATDGPEAEHLVQQWMQNVGKVSTSPPRLMKPTFLKRKPSVGSTSPSTSKGGNDKASKRQCTVCNWVFDEEQKWRWHEERHVGINLFKCTLCEHIFSTARQVYQHEMMEHGIIGTCDNMPDDKSSLKVAVVKNQYGTHYRRVPSLGGGSPQKKVKPKKANYGHLHLNFASRNSLIGIGEHEGQHLIESRKLKQLHWLYVCSKCENCSDSSAKAINHYKSCYPDGEPKFEETVVKFRQGFYGKCKCPLCPRRYTSLGGFLIHCGHMHQEYRRVFSHINSEDKMMCVTCRKKFDDPDTFHAHLNYDLTCNKMPVKEDGPTTALDNARQRHHHKLLGSNPRSARLQNRLAAVTACFEDDPVDESQFGDVDCPICGESSVPSITEHLHYSHKELNIEVERVEEFTLRCKPCGITFAICDLVAHNNSCTGSKSLNYVTQKRTSSTGGSGTGAKTGPKPKPPPEPIAYPPGIGTSPLETMEKSDLVSIDVIQEALQCGVCHFVGKKMNIVAECLRSHGIYRCSICFNSYTTKDQNSQHMRVCHSNNTGRLTCPLCGITRTNAGQLTSHMYLVHWLPVMQENALDIRTSKLLGKIKTGDSSTLSETSIISDAGDEASLNSTANTTDKDTEASGMEADESANADESMSSAPVLTAYNEDKESSKEEDPAVDAEHNENGKEAPAEMEKMEEDEGVAEVDKATEPVPVKDAAMETTEPEDNESAAPATAPAQVTKTASTEDSTSTEETISTADPATEAVKT